MTTDNGLKQAEGNLHEHAHCYGQVVFLARSKSPGADGFDGFLIQAHTQRLRHTDVAGVALRVDNGRLSFGAVRPREGARMYGETN